MAKRHSWQPDTGDIPSSPGVYRFLDPRGRVIYVGKAKNLRSRLTSYFQRPDALHERTRRMVESANGVDWTLVPTERQALQLEYSWIKQFQPEFNVRFRDDKSYPYVVVTLAEEIPRVFLARRKGIKGARYFGPFPQAHALRDTLSTILKAFPVRSCSATIYAKAKRDNRACLLGDIGKCSAPCVGRVTPEAHKSLAISLSSFLAGHDDQVGQDLHESMIQAAADLEFERAARIRDRIDAIQQILVKNTMVVSDDIDADIFGLAHDSLVAAAHVFRVRGGRVLSAKGFVVETPEDETASSLVELLLRDGFDDGPPARIVVVPELPGALQAWEEQLTALRREAGESGGVKLKTARRGELAQLEQTVTLNAAQTLQGYLSARTSDPSARSRALAEIQNALDLPEAPLRLECFDVSHLGGDNPVASMVVFEDGLARREHYRRFAITDARDDTEAIYQVVSRRLQRLLAPADDSESSRGFSYPPGLIVVDGGLPQVNAAQRALDELGVSIPVCGLAKKLEEVWRAHDDFPVILPRNSEALFLLQRARDEAHRVAIRYQRSTRKRTLRSELLDIPGLGTVAVAKILKHFGSVAKVKQASIDEITHVPGVGAVVAEKIHTFLQQR